MSSSKSAIKIYVLIGFEITMHYEEVIRQVIPHWNTPLVSNICYRTLKTNGFMQLEMLFKG